MTVIYVNVTLLPVLLLNWITVLRNVFINELSGWHCVSPKTNLLKHKQVHVDWMCKLSSHNDVTVFKVVADENQIKRLSLTVNKNLFIWSGCCSLPTSSEIVISPHTELVFHVAASKEENLWWWPVLVWRSCLSLTTELLSLLLLHIVPVLFRFRQTVPSADTVLSRYSLFKGLRKIYNPKWWLQWE